MDLRNLQHKDFDFWTPIESRWRDMDALGHLNHAAYLGYMESARVDLYIEMGYSGIRKDNDESTILASMEVHYLGQVSHPTILKIGQRISRIGSKSFDIMGGVFIKGQNKPVCTALFKMVAFNYMQNQSIPVPDKIKEKARPL